MKKKAMNKRQQIMIWALSLIVVLSMLCSYLVSVADTKEPRTTAPTPTTAPFAP
jgi:hypothetical protein